MNFFIKIHYRYFSVLYKSRFLISYKCELVTPPLSLHVLAFIGCYGIYIVPTYSLNDDIRIYQHIYYLFTIQRGLYIVISFYIKIAIKPINTKEEDDGSVGIPTTD